MKISYNWLKQYVENLPDPVSLAELLTNCGLEVESFENYSSVPGGLEGIYIAEVISKEKHPDADKLSVCSVSTGKEPLFNVVCGAPNVEKGQKVLLATIGAKVFKGDESFTICKAKIRGVVSEGMICAEDEIGLGNSHDGIMVLPDDAVVGTPASEYFGIYNDTVFEIGLTPNRSDAASHIGVARDIIAVLNLNSYKEKNSAGFKKNVVAIPDVDSFKISDNSLNIDVEIQNENCIRYSGVTISGVKVTESPEWLKNRLLSIGVRPINNIVDITNFVLFETGQPLHAFDAKKIKGNKVIIKTLADKTSFVTLDEVKRELSFEDLMICNAEEPMCIAGVFGGAESGISSSTESVFLESACFKPSSIRRSSKRHGLKTDASFRFERGADPEITIYAMKRAAALICDIAGGSVSSEIKDVYPAPVQPASVFLSVERLKMLTGVDIDVASAKVILESLNIEIIKEENGSMQLIIPAFKYDVTRECDVIEEILRIYGYDKIPLSGRVNASLGHDIESLSEKRKKIISSFLTANGFNEIMCNSLTAQSWYQNNDIYPEDKCVRILNPLSRELSLMRQTLLYGGLETILYNQNRKMPDVKLFEFGNVYQLAGQDKNLQVTERFIQNEKLALFLTGNKYNESWYLPEQKIDFYFLKAFVLNVLKKLGVNTGDFKTSDSLNALFLEGLELSKKNKVIVTFGQLNSSVVKKSGIKENVFYAEFDWKYMLELSNTYTPVIKDLPKFPEVRRDLALVLDKDVKYSDIEKSAFQTASPLLKSISLFDVYEGEKLGNNLKSYAIRFILEDPERTLTDEIIDNTMNKLIAAFEQKFGARLR